MPNLVQVCSFMLALGSACSVALAQSFVVQPYLQRATSREIEVHWETNRGGASYVEWGKTQRLGQRVVSHERPSERRAELHSAHLVGLQPDTRYFYRVHTGSLSSAIADLRTLPAVGSEAPVRMVVMSDMQLDQKHPHVFRDLVRDGVLPLARETARARGWAPHAVLLPGDLVRHGLRYGQWSEEFFAPLRPLAKHVPLYPVAGNHDEDSPYYFRYFSLPGNGSSTHPGHWWWSDFSNVRVIGLDTNTAYRSDEQLMWLEGVLAETRTAPHIDFVFVQMHHPEMSELWPRGELPYSGLVSRAMERFSHSTGKPSVIFTGHTHAYSRGHSAIAPVTLVGVASAGGDLDRRGEYEPHVHPEYVTSQDAYGFVIVDAQAGREPSVRIRRISRGTPEHPRNNDVTDDFTVRRYGMTQVRDSEARASAGEARASAGEARAGSHASAEQTSAKSP